MFSNNDLKKLIFPLVIEQLLAVSVGMADTMMVSNVGEEAVSGISLVNTICILLIMVFAALATGGAVVSAQYIGKQNMKKANDAADQLLLVCLTISLIIMGFALIFNKQILSLIYGSVEAKVMNNAITYFYITALSFPFLSLYNACASLFRSMSNSKISMKASIIMNIINVVGNAICIFGLHMGVEGAAIPTLISRAVAAIIMYYLIRQETHKIHASKRFVFKPDMPIVKDILRIGIPNGLENGMFQIGKLLTQSLISSFGTYAIAANAVASNLEPLVTLPANAVGLSLVTIVGQCVGAKKYDEATYYVKKLIKVVYCCLFVLDIIIIFFAPQICKMYNLSPQSLDYCLTIVRSYGICSMIIFPYAFTISSALRGAGDVRFTMINSVSSMWIFRIGLAFVFGKFLNLGVVGVWFAMYSDWFVRGTMNYLRFKSNKWRDKGLA